jgi:hypothetical protein
MTDTITFPAFPFINLGGGVIGGLVLALLADEVFK